MRKQTSAMLYLVVSLLGLTPGLFGQASATNAAITGAVTDPSGAAVSGANITATNTQTGFKETAKTASEGVYRFPVLPPGVYDLSVDASGFGPSKRTGIVLTAGATATVDIGLTVAGAATTVEVSAAGIVTEPDRTDIGSTLDFNTTSNLPLVSRNPFNFVLFQPNVSGRSNTEFGVPRKINANGFNGRINYQLDGGNNTESDRAGIRLIPISNTYVQEIQQVSNGFAPEFGNTVGTVFNTITRSGSNEFHGDAAYIFRRTDMSARPKLTPASSPAPEVNVDDFAVDGGGRLVRDKLFFFGAFEHVKRDLPMVVTVSPSVISQLGLPANYENPVPFSQSVWFYMAKVDWQINQSNRLTFRYNHHANDSPYNDATIGGLFVQSRTYNFVDRSHVGSVQLISTVTPTAINELRMQLPNRSQAQNRFAATGTGPAIVISGLINFGGPTNVGFLYEEKTPEIVDNFTVTKGAHSIKVGTDLRWIRDTQTQATFAQYTFASTAAYLAAANGTSPLGYTSFSQTFGNPSIGYNSMFAGAYLQDTWKPVRNATITYGVRYDIYVPPSAQSNAPFVYSRKFNTDGNNFAPRLGIAYGIGKDQKTVIRASGGLFYDPFQTDQYRRALLNNGSPQIFNISATPANSFAPTFPNVFTSTLPAGFTLAQQDINTVAPDFATLYSLNANFSITRQVGQDMSISAGYLYTAGNRLPIYRNINVVPSGQFLADGRPIFSTTARVFPGFANILSAESTGHSTYSGANLTFSKRSSHGYEFYATYTWSHAIDDAPEQNNIDSGAFLLADPTDRHRDRADSLTDKRHVFNMTGVFHAQGKNYLLRNNQLSITIQAATGDVFNMGSNQVLNKDTSEGTAYQRPVFIGRNTMRAPAVFEMNARYSRFFPIKERSSFEFFAESTNLTNRLNVTSINSTAQVNAAGVILVPASGLPLGGRDQRLLQLGIKYNF
jgi:hypothetical protein